MAAPARWRHGRTGRSVSASLSGQHGQVAHEVHAALGSILAGAVAAGSTMANCACGASGSTWRRRGGEVLELHGLVVDKGDQGDVPDKVGSGGEHTGDGQELGIGRAHV